MSNKKKAILYILALFANTLVTTAMVQGKYSSIYLDRTPIAASKVIFSTKFEIDDPTVLDQSAALMSVMSAAGGYGSGSTGGNGCMYQNVIACWDDGEVFYCPQAYAFCPANSSTMRLFISAECLNRPFDDGWELYVGKMVTDIANEEVDYYWYAYETEDDIISESYYYDYYSGTAHEDDHNFVVGDRTDTYHYRYTQVGVESTPEINGTDWKILQEDIGYYYSGSWRYSPGRTNTGLESIIVCDGGDYLTAIRVGDWSEYGGVTIYNYDYALVCWQNNQNSRISDDVSVWTGSGTLNPIVSAPYT